MTDDLAFDGEAMYITLENIAELQAKIHERIENNDVPVFGDKDVLEHRDIMKNFLILSYEDLVSYHSFVKGKVKEAEKSITESIEKVGKAEFRCSQLESGLTEAEKELEEKKVVLTREQRREYLHQLKEEIYSELRNVCSDSALDNFESVVETAYQRVLKKKIDNK